MINSARCRLTAGQCGGGGAEHPPPPHHSPPAHLPLTVVGKCVFRRRKKKSRSYIYCGICSVQWWVCGRSNRGDGSGGVVGGGGLGGWWVHRQGPLNLRHQAQWKKWERLPPPSLVLPSCLSGSFCCIKEKHLQSLCTPPFISLCTRVFTLSFVELLLSQNRSFRFLLVCRRLFDCMMAI